MFDGLKIIILCLHVANSTGSEIYFYELAKSLVKLGHDVTICTLVTSETMLAKAEEKGFKIVTQQDFDKIKDKVFDTFIVSHWQVTKKVFYQINKHKHTKFINICHSEVYDIEFPAVDFNFDAYVGIRQSIVDLIINRFSIDESKVHLVFNPFNLKRFNLENTSDDKFGLFAGTYLDLRMPSIEHFHYLCKSRNLKSVFIGANHENNTLYDESLPSRWDIEALIKKSSICGGIIYGRTYWEAKLCGKEVVEYMIDQNGQIIEVINECAPSNNEHDDLFDKLENIKVAQRILNTVYSII